MLFKKYKRKRKSDKSKKQYGAIEIVAMSYSKKNAIQKYVDLEKVVGV